MATSAAQRAHDKPTPAEPTAGHGVLHLPAVHVPHVPVPSVHVGMPTGTKGRVLWWGGLAAVAAFGVVDWPVAGLIAAGSLVAEQYAKAARSQDQAATTEPDKSQD